MKTGARWVLALLLAVVGPARAGTQGDASRPRIGLALSGGSARGIAHVGVLQWLEEHQIPVDAIAGTSTGAFVGGAYATGWSAVQIQDLLRNPDRDLIMRPDIPYRLKAARRKEDDRDYALKTEAGLRGGVRPASGRKTGHGVGPQPVPQGSGGGRGDCTGTCSSCLLYTSPSPPDPTRSRIPSFA